MSTRASVFQHVRLGAEVTPGTAVAANKRLLNTRFAPNPNAPVEAFRPVGSKYATGATLQKESVAGSFEGALSFYDICYILSSVLGKDASPGSPWTFTSDSWNPDDPQTYTMNRGSSARAEGYNFALMTGVEINLARNGATVRGDFIGKKMTEAVTMVSATDIQSLPVWPKNISVLVGDTVAGLTEITRCIMMSVNLRGKWNPAFFFSSTEDSFSDIVEMAPDFTAQLQVERNSVASGYMADLRTAKQKFIRWIVTGPLTVGSGTPAHSIQCTMPFLFQPETSDDVDGIMGATFPLIPDHESTYGKAIEFVVVNDLAGL